MPIKISTYRQSLRRANLNMIFCTSQMHDVDSKFPCQQTRIMQTLHADMDREMRLQKIEQQDIANNRISHDIKSSNQMVSYRVR